MHNSGFSNPLKVMADNANTRCKSTGHREKAITANSRREYLTAFIYHTQDPFPHLAITKVNFFVLKFCHRLSDNITLKKFRAKARSPTFVQNNNDQTHSLWEKIYFKGFSRENLALLNFFKQYIVLEEVTHPLPTSKKPSRCVVWWVWFSHKTRRVLQSNSDGGTSRYWSE